MVMSSLYDAQLETEHEQKLFIVPILLKEACRQITLTNLPHSGWVQFFLYQTLYCTDVEKPEAEIPIKRVSVFYQTKGAAYRVSVILA